jgi:hypothetical protein
LSQKFRTALAIRTPYSSYECGIRLHISGRDSLLAKAICVLETVMCFDPKRLTRFDCAFRERAQVIASVQILHYTCSKIVTKAAIPFERKKMQATPTACKNGKSQLPFIWSNCTPGQRLLNTLSLAFQRHMVLSLSLMRYAI